MVLDSNFLLIFQGTSPIGIQRSRRFLDCMLLEACLHSEKVLKCRYCRFRSVVLSTFGVHSIDSEVMCPLSSLRWLNVTILFGTTATVFFILRKANPENVLLCICFHFVETSKILSMVHSDHECSHYFIPILFILH